jgi:hypothetical protein
MMACKEIESVGAGNATMFMHTSIVMMMMGVMVIHSNSVQQ